MATNYAKFKITGSVGGLSASSAGVYRAVPGEVLTLELEDAGPVQTVLYELNGTGADDQPLKSYSAPTLQFAGAVASKLVSPANGTTTITMPTAEMDTHSWILRATASLDGGPHIFERKIVYLMGKPDKNIPGETTQASSRGWYDEVAKLIGSALPFYDARRATTDATPVDVGDGWMPPRSCNVELRGSVTAQRFGTAAHFKAWDFLGMWQVDAGGVITVTSAAAFTLVRDLSGGAFAPGTPAINIASSKLYPRVTGIAADVRWHAFWDARVQVFA